jgi:hypothetical protein
MKEEYLTIIVPNQNSRAAKVVQSYACGHSDTAEKIVGDPPYAVQIPSQGGQLCPECFLNSIHEGRFIEHECRLNLGKLEGAPYDVWFSMMLRQRQVLRYEAQIRSRTDLSEAGKDQVLTLFLASVRSISTRHPCQAWQAGSRSREPAYQEMEDALVRTLLHVLLSGAPIPTCDGIVTLKVVDLTPLKLRPAELVSLQTLDAWNAASLGIPLVLVCHKTALRLMHGAIVRELQEERVGYLIEDPVTLHFLWHATRREFLKNVMVEGQLQRVYEEWPIYRVEAPHVIDSRSFLVKPSFSHFGLSWCYHPIHMPTMQKVGWIDDLWEFGGIADHLQFATDIRINGTQECFPPMHHEEDRPLCLYCTQPIDLTRVSTLGDGVPDCCASCSHAWLGVPHTLRISQRVRQRQNKPLSPLGPTPALCACLHHSATQCTQKTFGQSAQRFRPCSCACHTSISGQPVGEEDWHNARVEWERRRRDWDTRID